MGLRKKSPGVGQTIGSVLAGFDQQVFRTTPPPHEQVKKGDRLPSVPAEDGGTLSIDLPAAAAAADPLAPVHDDPADPTTGD